MDTVIIVGDFNFPNVDWIQDTNSNRFFLPVNVKSGVQEDTIINLLSRDLSQMNHVKNYRGGILDLLFSSNTDDLSVVECLCPLVPVDAYHIPFKFKIDFRTINIIEPNQCTREFNFKRANFNQLNGILSAIDWSQLSLSDDINSAVDFFYEILLRAMNECIPRRISKPNCHPPWFNRPVLKLKNLKCRAYKRYKRSMLRSDYTAYSLLRNALHVC